MRRFLDITVRMLVVTALCAAALGTAVRPGHSSPQTTFFVSNTFDNGAGSLRQAILDANNTPGEDVIHINAIGTVNLLSALPTITEAVTIFVQDAHLRFFIVDGQNLYRGLNITSVPVTISGLILRNGVAFGTATGGGINSEGDLTLNAVHVLNSDAGSGGGVYSSGSVVVNGGRFEGNSAVNDGGAIYTEDALTLANTEIVSNTAVTFGGGVIALGALVITGTLFISNTSTSTIVADGGGAFVFGPGPVQVTNSRFENNSTSVSGAGRGGGMYVSIADTMTLNNVDFVGNTGFHGGGLYADAGDGLNIHGGRFEQNTAEFNGGGLFGENVVLTDTQFISNTSGSLWGGAVVNNIVAMGGRFEYNTHGALGARNMVLTDTQFINNSGGPAAFAYSTQATNVLFANNNHNALDSRETVISDSQFVNNSRGIVAQGPLTVTNSLFMNNAPSSAIHAYYTMTISSTLFLGNSGSLGGALAQFNAGDALIVNSLFAGNTASESSAALHLAGEGTATLKHVTIASSELVTTTAITTTKEIVNIQNSIVANHDIGLNVTSGFVALSHVLFHDNGLDIQGTVAAEENRITGDPLFVTPDADDFHLQIGSAAIDAGMDAGITTDFEGDVRPSLNGFDVGFDEVILDQVYQVMLPIIIR